MCMVRKSFMSSRGICNSHFNNGLRKSRQNLRVIFHSVIYLRVGEIKPQKKIKITTTSTILMMVFITGIFLFRNGGKFWYFNEVYKGFRASLEKRNQLSKTFPKVNN